MRLWSTLPNDGTPIQCGEPQEHHTTYAPHHRWLDSLTSQRHFLKSVQTLLYPEMSGGQEEGGAVPPAQRSGWMSFVRSYV